MALNRSEVKTPAPTSEETLNVKFSAKSWKMCRKACEDLEKGPLKLMQVFSLAIQLCQ